MSQDDQIWRNAAGKPPRSRPVVFTPAEQVAVDAYVAALMAKAPPLSDEKRDRLALLFRRPVRRRGAA